MLLQVRADRPAEEKQPPLFHLNSAFQATAQHDLS